MLRNIFTPLLKSAFDDTRSPSRPSNVVPENDDDSAEDFAYDVRVEIMRRTVEELRSAPQIAGQREVNRKCRWPTTVYICADTNVLCRTWNKFTLCFIKTIEWKTYSMSSMDSSFLLAYYPPYVKLKVPPMNGMLQCVLRSKWLSSLCNPMHEIGPYLRCGANTISADIAMY